MMQRLSLLELPVLEALASLHGCVPLNRLMLLISKLGDGGFIFIAAALALLCIRQTRLRGAVCATALALDALLVNLVLKPLIARPRPWTLAAFDLLLTPPGDFSFPSGHTAAAFAFASVLFFCDRRHCAPAVVFACLTAFSRLYLSVHFPTDVLSGIVIGIACGRAALFLWKKVSGRDIMDR